jgi:hypothetical protein
MSGRELSVEQIYNYLLALTRNEWGVRGVACALDSYRRDHVPHTSTVDLAGAIVEYVKSKDPCAGDETILRACYKWIHKSSK